MEEAIRIERKEDNIQNIQEFQEFQAIQNELQDQAEDRQVEQNIMQDAHDEASLRAANVLGELDETYDLEEEEDDIVPNIQ